jgi:hypothetical protein
MSLKYLAALAAGTYASTKPVITDTQNPGLALRLD